jgi:hypothetical protein
MINRYREQAHSYKGFAVLLKWRAQKSTPQGASFKTVGLY